MESTQPKLLLLELFLWWHVWGFFSFQWIFVCILCPSSWLPVVRFKSCYWAIQSINGPGDPTSASLNKLIIKARSSSDVQWLNNLQFQWCHSHPWPEVLNGKIALPLWVEGTTLLSPLYLMFPREMFVKNLASFPKKGINQSYLVCFFLEEAECQEWLMTTCSYVGHEDCLKAVGMTCSWIFFRSLCSNSFPHENLVVLRVISVCMHYTILVNCF